MAYIFMRTLISEIVNKENEQVVLMGWVAVRRDHGKLIFIDLRDASGICQVVFTPALRMEIFEKAGNLRSEWVIKVSGKVSRRPASMVNKEILTGEYEIQAEELEVLNKAETPPFDLIDDGYEVDEEVRMRYRYLDLRRQRLRKNLFLRSSITQFAANFLIVQGFLEIETPILTKSTPEGARDYLVPSRVHNGKFYALPQSPQQYKQLLMAAGIEKYFQIARCFRDEDTRGDRQPEFTQLDIEMSFCAQEEILELTEELLVNLIEKFFPEKKISQKPFPRLNYKDALDKYGTDKPDLRENKSDQNELALVFIVNFPMFEWKASDPSASSGQGKGRWDAVHHPFTMPQVKDTADFLEKFKADAGKILAYQYDVVLNGYEIGGGSIRIHNAELLQAVFEMMGNKPEDIESKFSHLLEAFKYGAPPHGGIAVGLDRLFMILFNEPNIREVIAFPKTGDGRDLMMNAPSEAEKRQLDELGIEIKKQKK